MLISLNYHPANRLRSYLGYPPVRYALPNTTHCAIAALQYTSIIPRLITQNVDGLHHKALAHVWDKDRLKDRILELHGTLHVCQNSPWCLSKMTRSSLVWYLSASALQTWAHHRSRHLSRLAFCCQPEMESIR